MVDPLGPFVTLIGTLSRRKPEAAESASGASAVDSDNASHGAARASRPATDLKSKLRSRLGEVGAVDPDRARRTFVETVLLWQLGDELARDPAFGDLVVKVADQLQSDRELRSRLSDLIAVLAA
jgi:hypothetical protein